MSGLLFFFMMDHFIPACCIRKMSDVRLWISWQPCSLWKGKLGGDANIFRGEGVAF